MINQITRYLIFVSVFMFFSGELNAQWIQVGVDIDGDFLNDESGSSVCMNSAGDRIAIGAPLNDGNGSNSGRVQIFEWSGSTWSQMGYALYGEAAGDLFGSAIDMNSSGNRLAIGANLNDGSGSNAGHVRVYEWNSITTNWVQLGLDIDGEAANDLSGCSVSLNSLGNRLAIGAYRNNGSGSNAGHVRIYEWNGSSWTQLGLDIDGEFANDQSGFSVSLNGGGDRIAIGATSNTHFAGHTRIYEWNGVVWTQVGADINGESFGTHSGYSVSMNFAGDRLAIGAPYNDGGANNAGHVRVYEWQGTSWTQLGADIDGEGVQDYSGNSVIMDDLGKRVAIGAFGNSGNGREAGHVRVYEWSSTTSTWMQIGSDIDGEALDDFSGHSVGMNSTGNLIIIGAPRNDKNGNLNLAGHARVYRYGLSTMVTEIKKEQSFSLYPNPVRDYLSLKSLNANNEIIQLKSITGAVLLQSKISKEIEVFDLSAFPNGLYFLKVGKETRKFIIAR